MRFAGVATGVRNAAAATTASAIRNGCTETSMATASDIAMGARMSTVAALLMS